MISFLDTLVLRENISIYRRLPHTDLRYLHHHPGQLKKGKR